MRATSRGGERRPPACPHWCRRDHHADDPVDDLLHQSGPVFVAVIHGDPRFGREAEPTPDRVVLRLMQRPGSSAVWLEAISEEGRSVELVLSAESAGRLSGAIIDLLGVT